MAAPNRFIRRRRYYHHRWSSPSYLLLLIAATAATTASLLSRQRHCDGDTFAPRCDGAHVFAQAWESRSGSRARMSFIGRHIYRGRDSILNTQNDKHFAIQSSALVPSPTVSLATSSPMRLFMASTNPISSATPFTSGYGGDSSNYMDDGSTVDTTHVAGIEVDDDGNTTIEGEVSIEDDGSGDGSATGTTKVEEVVDAWRVELSSHDLQRLESTAKNAARAAGEIIAQAAKFTDETGHPPSVQLYDRQAQVAIQTVIGLRYPTQWFLQGKTAPAAEPIAPIPLTSNQDPVAVHNAVLEASASTSDILWIYDPIDGTANFAAGLELSAVTMAVVYKGTVVVSCVYDPYQDEMFSAVKGRGAFLNDEHRLFVNKDVVTQLSDAIVNTGIPDVTPLTPNVEKARASFPVAMRGVRALNGYCRGVRMVSCNALAAAWIAAGRLSAHICYDINSWDLAAGALLIQEAGGRVSDLYGLPFVLSTRNLLCSNSMIHDTILDILDGADAVYVDTRNF